MFNLLREYSKEVYGEGSTKGVMSVEQLIDSHRTLRQLRLDTNEYRMQAVEEGRAWGYKQGLEQVNREYIKVEDLKQMTMAQIAALLYDGDN